MKHHLQASLTTVGVILSVGLLAACSSASSDAGAGTSNSDPIVIGYVGPLTGPVATYGVPILNGATMAIKEANASGGVKGRQIKLVQLDDKGDATTTATNVQQLLTQDKVTAIIGGVTTGTTQAQIPLVVQYKTPLITTSLKDPSFTAPSAAGFKYTFGAGETSTYDVQSSIKYFQDAKAKSICTIADTSAYGQSSIDQVNKVFDDQKIPITKQITYTQGATDLTPQILQLKDAGCDAVYAWTQGGDTTTFMKTLTTLSWSPTVVGASGIGVGAFLDGIDSTDDGLILSTTVDLDRPGVSDFVKKYNTAYGQKSDPAYLMSSYGYDAAKLLVAGLTASDGAGGDKLTDALNQVTVKDGVTGRTGMELNFTATKHNAPNDGLLTFLQIKDGQIVQIDPARK